MATPTSGEITWTVADITAKTGLSPDKVQQAVKEQLITPVSRGRYSPFPTLVGLIKFLDAQLGRPLTVNKDELREITGLSDQRHRQLANDGQFPPPIRGRYQLREVCAGIIRYFRELHGRRDKTLSEKRERKLDNENALLELTLSERNRELILIDDMESRLRPMLVACRQKVLGSSMTDEEKDELLTDMGVLLENALTRSKFNPTQTASTDLDQTAATHDQQMG